MRHRHVLPTSPEKAEQNQSPEGPCGEYLHETEEVRATSSWRAGRPRAVRDQAGGNRGRWSPLPMAIHVNKDDRPQPLDGQDLLGAAAFLGADLAVFFGAALAFFLSL